MRRLFCFLLLTAAALSAGPKSLFYLTSDPAGIASFLQHASKIDILVPTWYNVDPAGAVTGGPNAQVMDAAKRFHVPVMPIVVNPGFNQDNFHKLVTDTAARRRMIAAIAAESRRQGYIGFQFDFENIIETDRDALTVLVTEAAQAMHQAGLQLSIAAVPNAPGYAGEGGFSKWIFGNWRAAYDLKGIGAAVDLLCLMTYDEHTRYTPPGPVAGHQWTVANLDYALKSVPKEKLSLGIPVYGYRWYAGDPGADGKPNVRADTVGGADVRQLIDAFHPQVQWDDEDRASFFRFYRDATREWVYYTDARTFQPRIGSSALHSGGGERHSGLLFVGVGQGSPGYLGSAARCGTVAVGLCRTTRGSVADIAAGGAKGAVGSRTRYESYEQTGANVEEFGEFLCLLLTDGTLSRQNLGDAAFGPDDRPEIARL